MGSSACRPWSMMLFTLLALLTSELAASADGPIGTFAVISDIHFNPFAAPELALRLAGTEPGEWPAILASATGQGFPFYGEDTNQALFASALAALSERAGNADLVIVPGDLLAHRFNETAARVLGTSVTSRIVRSLAANTALYVAGALHAALPKAPIVIGLGNNDSECGDYRLEPGGPFLAALRDMVRDLAESDRVASDFDQTFEAGGYYAVRHPMAAATTILVINDVLWSTNYRDACGGDGDAAALAMMDWLERRLDEERAAGRQVWLVHHIPIGIDPYATLHASANLACSARITPFLREPFASRFVSLLRKYATTIQADFSGHIHQDSYRIVRKAGVAVDLEKIAPSISPVFGNNPGFHLFGYDRQTGEPLDFATWYLANLDQASATVPGEWRREYVFTEAYHQHAYSAAAVATVAEALLGTDATGEAIRDTYRKLYPVNHREIADGELPAYACAIGNLDASSFGACYCGR